MVLLQHYFARSPVRVPRGAQAFHKSMVSYPIPMGFCSLTSMKDGQVLPNITRDVPKLQSVNPVVNPDMIFFKVYGCSCPFLCITFIEMG